MDRSAEELVQLAFSESILEAAIGMINNNCACPIIRCPNILTELTKKSIF